MNRTDARVARTALFFALANEGAGASVLRRFSLEVTEI